MTEKTLYTAAQRLDRLPESPFHRRLALLIGLGLFFDAFDLYMASGVMVALMQSGWATMASNAQFVAAGSAGALIGAGLAGWLGDRFGRRFTFQFNLALFGLGSIAAALAPSMDWLIVQRFIMGIGLGAEIIVGYATISEFVPPSSRGKWGAVLFFLATAALLASSLASYWIIPALGWRWMFGIAGIGGLIVWVLRKQMPESPRWLESTGRVNEASAILDRIEAEVERVHGPLPQPAASPQVPPSIKQGDARFLDLFKRPLIWSTILGIVMNIVGLSSIYGFIIWLPTFFVKQGLSIAHSLGYSALMSAGSLLGIVLAGTVADRWSRKRFLVVMSLVSAALGVVYPYAGSVVLTTVIGFALITSLYAGSTVGFSTYVPELFPTELRLRGTGVSGMAGRGASIVAPLFVSALFSIHGVESVTLALVAMILVQAVVIGILGFNTSRRSLDDVLHAGH